MVFELIFLCYNERKWRSPRKIRQKVFSFKSTGIDNIKQIADAVQKGL